MLKENIKLAIFSMAANKMRTLLSLLGIMIGVASVVAIMTLGQSATDSINEALEIGGIDMVTVMPMGSARELQIFDETFGNTLMQNVPGIDSVLPSASMTANLRNGQETIRGNVSGVYSSYGLKFFRINDARFRPGENGLLKFDIYSPRPTILQVCIGAEQGGTPVRYSCALRVAGGECWADHLLSAKDFKSEINKPLSGLNAARYITFYSQDEFCINNLLWL